MRTFPFGWLRPALAGALLLHLTAAAGAEDWPQWRGPDRNGVSRETGLMQAWPGRGPAQLWQTGALGAGYGPVSVSGGRVYAQGTRGRNSVVVCLDAATGRGIWERELGPMLMNDMGDGPRSAPTVEGDRLYALTGMGELACLSVANGSMIWRRNILRDFGASNITWGISESPLIEGEKLIVTPGGRDAGIVALDKSNGELLWATRELRGQAGYASAIAADVGSVRTIIQFTSAAGVGVRADNGEILWEYAAAANGTANIASPVFSDGKVFYTSDYGMGGGLLSLTPSNGGVEAEEVYFTRQMRNHHGGVVLVDGYLYGFSSTVLTCLDFETGQVMWRDRSVGKGSLIAADGRLYIMGEDQVVGLADISPEGYRERGRFRIPSRGQLSWAHPVVANGRLYLRNQDQILCYDITAQPGGAIAELP